MSQLKHRLGNSKPLLAELLVSSVFINLLALASPIFVIQVLSRYVANGVTGTLITLTCGMVIAVLLEFCFRILRSKVAYEVSRKADQALSKKVFNILSYAKQSQLDRISKGLRQELMRDLDKVQRAYRSSTLTALLDVPFAGIFILVIALLNIWLAVIACGGILLTLLIGWYGLFVSRESQRGITEAAVVKNGVLNTAINAPDTVRTFNAQGFVTDAWNKICGKIQSLNGWVEHRQNFIQTLTQTVTVLSTVCLIAVGAKLVVASQLDVGALIGANILCARSISPFSRLAQMASSLLDAQESEKRLDDFMKLAVELQEGTAIKRYSGKLEFHDMGFAYPGSSVPLFEAFSCALPVGGLAVFAGFNGSGKTTFSRLLTGLIEPSRGQILIDNIDLRQISVQWWHCQVCYLPQEVTFFNGTLQQNITMTNPDLTGEQLNQLIKLADLRDFIDSSRQGLGTVIQEQGSTLSAGIRKRIALARALATGGQLVVFDEPTESLDDKGIQAVYQVLAFLKKQGRTVVVFGNDKKLIEQAEVIVDLGVKPTPAVNVRDPKASMGVDNEQRDA